MHQPTDGSPAPERPPGGDRGDLRSPVQRRTLLRCAGIGLASLLLFTALLVLVKADWSPLARLDHGWVAALHRYAVRHSVWTAAMQTMADLGAPWTMRALLGAAALWLWCVRARVLAGWAVSVGLLGWAASGGGRALIGRPRPHFADPVAIGSGAGFPSGHAIASAVTCGALLVLLWPRADRAVRAVAGTGAALTVLGVGWTRLALGVHYPSDVLAGWAAAAAVLAGVTLAVELWLPGRFGRDVRRLHWRLRSRVQRVLAPPLPLEPDHEPGRS
ncbi:phosphatase PAP2 family protein [Kitasatospora sp. CB01950]|uniref:phosphatase PAP2 family protein n=1 Tax=Kitasatospora sp. CB01950 TaxID=1703930 RepID=UPI00093A1CCC|nr:phosphatase PAP2 family protein [Kitasatospora sp. CB01950]